MGDLCQLLFCVLAQFVLSNDCFKHLCVLDATAKYTQNYLSLRLLMKMEWLFKEF